MKNNNDKVFVIIKPKEIMIKTETDTSGLKDISLSKEELTYKIVAILNSI